MIERPACLMIMKMQMICPWVPQEEPNDRQEHNACHLNDVDWYLFQAIQATICLIGAIQKAGGAAMRMEIYDIRFDHADLNGSNRI